MGDQGERQRSVVKPGNLEESLLYEVLNLPPDDDLFMPPKGGALTTERIDVFKRWITEGAKPSAGEASQMPAGCWSR